MPGKSSASFKIAWIARMLRIRFDARARGLGLTQAQWKMIVTVRLSSGATQGEIASELEINTVTAGRIIERLEASGWIERRSDPSDLRVSRLYATEKADPVLSKLNKVGRGEEQALLDGFSPEERALLVHFLDRIAENLASSMTTKSEIGKAGRGSSPVKTRQRRVAGERVGPA